MSAIPLGSGSLRKLQVRSNLSTWFRDRDSQLLERMQTTGQDENGSGGSIQLYGYRSEGLSREHERFVHDLGKGKERRPRPQLRRAGDPSSEPVRRPVQEFRRTHVASFPGPTHSSDTDPIERIRLLGPAMELAATGTALPNRAVALQNPHRGLILSAEPGVRVLGCGLNLIGFMLRRRRCRRGRRCCRPCW